MLDRVLAIVATEGHRYLAMLAQGCPDAVGIVAAVGNHPFHADDLADPRVRALHTGCVARLKDEAERSAEDIDKRLDLRCPERRTRCLWRWPARPFLRHQRCGGPSCSRCRFGWFRQSGLPRSALPRCGAKCLGGSSGSSSFRPLSNGRIRAGTALEHVHDARDHPSRS